MVYQTIRPASAPYNLGGAGLAVFSAAFGVVAPISSADLGSLADDSDSTYVTLSSNSNGVSYDATVIAVDFAPIPGLVVDSPFGAFVRMSRPWTPGDGESYQNNVIALYDSDWTLLGQFDFNDVANQLSSDLETWVAATATTYTSGNDWFSASGSLAGGFTAVMVVRANVAASTAVLRVQEFGLICDVAPSAKVPMRRKYPNPTGRGVGPTRHWPPPRRGVGGIN